MMIRTLCLGLLCLATVSTVWADDNAPKAPEMSLDEKAAVMKTLAGHENFIVCEYRCRMGQTVIGRYSKLYEAIARVRETKDSQAWITVGKPSEDQHRKWHSLNDVMATSKETGSNVYLVNTSLRCGTPYVVNKIASNDDLKTSPVEPTRGIVVVQYGEKPATLPESESKSE